MDKKEAIIIMLEHIDTFHYQLSDKGWNEMEKMGLVDKGIKARLEHASYAYKQIAAYELAIAALKKIVKLSE